MGHNPPWLLVGLGNPGPQYARNRHNVGFMAVDAWCEQFMPPPIWREKWNAHVTTARLLGIRCEVLKPQTYMNRSGLCVVQAARYSRIPPQQILVVHDEIDFPPGRLAVKKGGGHGGHNGLRDIIQQLGTREFLRIRLGVGRPPGKTEVSQYVLADFSTQDQRVLPELLEQAARAISCVIKDGVATAMNQFNQLPRKASTQAPSAKTSSKTSSKASSKTSQQSPVSEPGAAAARETSSDDLPAPAHSQDANKE
ncbi:MAG: aminoacyl-tRNA hydrolase [Myxococcales bacterium]|nr:aminoacyl-tRNA hydrolase [Myxococcales bacterium]